MTQPGQSNSELWLCLDCMSGWGAWRPLPRAFPAHSYIDPVLAAFRICEGIPIRVKAVD